MDVRLYQLIKNPDISINNFLIQLCSSGYIRESMQFLLYYVIFILFHCTIFGSTKVKVTLSV